MLIICAGMPKAGTAWFFHLTNDILANSGFADTHYIREKYQLENFIKFSECNIQELTEEKLKILTSPPIGDHTFAVKTHFPPSKHLIELIHLGKIKTMYIFRDPRDTIVSAFEAGQKLRKRGIFERFAKLKTMKEGIIWADKGLRNYERWLKIKPLFFRYEDLLRKTLSQLKIICSFLKIKADTEILNKIMNNWQAEQLPKKGISLHFNKGEIGRHQKIMNQEELELCNKKFRRYLDIIGYSA